MATGELLRTDTRPEGQSTDPTILQDIADPGNGIAIVEGAPIPDATAQRSMDIGTPGLDEATSRFSRENLLAGAATLVAAITPFAATETSVASASTGPTARASSVPWSTLGGDPLKPHINTEAKAVKLLHTRKGRTAMRLMDLSAKDRAALKKAARKGGFTDCKTTYGEHFEASSFSNPVRVHRDVVFVDPRYKKTGADAWCLHASRVLGEGKNGKFTKKISIEITELCGNISLKNIVQVKIKTPGSPPRQPGSHTSNPQVQPMPNQPPVIIINNSPNQTNTQTNGDQSQQQQQQQQQQNNGGTTTPPQQYPREFSVDLQPREHLKTRGEAEICAYKRDPKNTIVSSEFTDEGKVNIISQNPYPGDEEGEVCVMIKGETEAGDGIIKFTARDEHNNVQSDSETIKVDDSAAGEF